jgi:hypothetical protein
MDKVRHVPPNHPLNRLAPALRGRFVSAQSEMIEEEFRTASELLSRVLDDLKMKLAPPSEFDGEPVGKIADLSHKDLHAFFEEWLRKSGVPDQANRRQTANLAHRVQLLRAFKNPDAIVKSTAEKVAEVVDGFPRRAEHLEQGRNPGDVLDPYILAASMQLVYGGNLEGTITGMVSHKILMIIEGLLGHLHEDVIGAMRGNVRAPEPRGDDQETLDPASNPFPGADIVQPPLGQRPLRFHQVKSKTGSAKGGDGKRLGLQLLELQKKYGGEIYYDSLIGNTLRGHRSMRGVLKAAPNAVVLVGESAFESLTGSTSGPELLLRLYQTAFEVAAQRTGYRIQETVEAICGTFKQQADRAGESFLDTILHRAVNGPPENQDSRVRRTERTLFS